MGQVRVYVQVFAAMSSWLSLPGDLGPGISTLPKSVLHCLLYHAAISVSVHSLCHERGSLCSLLPLAFP